MIWVGDGNNIVLTVANSREINLLFLQPRTIHIIIANENSLVFAAAGDYSQISIGHGGLVDYVAAVVNTITISIGAGSQIDQTKTLFAALSDNGPGSRVITQPAGSKCVIGP